MSGKTTLGGYKGNCVMKHRTRWLHGKLKKHSIRWLQGKLCQETQHWVVPRETVSGNTAVSGYMIGINKVTCLYIARHSIQCIL